MERAKKVATRVKLKVADYKKRRPHTSFRLTNRRDYKRSLALPGYWSFTSQVSKFFWRNSKSLLVIALIYAVLTGLLVGLASQDTYLAFKDSFADNTTGWLEGASGELIKLGTIFTTMISGGFSANLTEAQQTYAIILGFMVWLATIWLLRNLAAGHKVKIRDALYNSGAPIIPTLFLGVVLIVQLIPIALALIAYGAASTSGLLSGGVEAMLFWMAAGLLALLSFYWVASTALALVIVTLPGTYPLKALTTAGDLLVGRRFRLLLRLLWMLLGVLVIWAAVMIPVILIDDWLKGLWSWMYYVPLVPLGILGMSSLSVVLMSTYIYFLYRKVLEDETPPA